MKPVTIDPQTLTTVAATHTSAATLVAGRAAAERFDAAALAPTFGVIGANFLASLSATLNARCAQLDAQASSHSGQAAATAAGAAAYVAADTQPVMS